jgi:4-alpha-glucanotransferase
MSKRGSAAAKRPTPSGRFTFNRRASGVLLHPTSLPGPFGSGDLGPAAHAFAEFLAAAGQRWWQMLPVGPPGEGHSPYSAASAFAGHPALISPEMLVEEGLLKPDELKAPVKFNAARVEHDRVLNYRNGLLDLAHERFERRGGTKRKDYQAFLREHAFWLEDYALFAAIKEANEGRRWSEWEPALRQRERKALARAAKELAPLVDFHRFVQFQFDRQWQGLRARCAEHGIGLIGDIPIFVAFDSAEVWANPHLFLLDRDGRPKVVSGCPPDFFNANGQMWNHPHYDWPAHAREGYRWWVERFRQTLRLFDGVRIDHFIGFHRAWAIPASSSNARKGRYTPGPGENLFQAIQKKLGDVPIIAEDLGSVTPEVFALRDRFSFPGMRVLQFGFGDGGEYHLPHNYPRRCVAYTGTHDNDTTAGWFEKIPAKERRRVEAYACDGRCNGSPAWALIRAALASVADTAIFPAQDLLDLGSESRMNLPGTVEKNWAWRLKLRVLSPKLAKRLRAMCELFQRV